MLSGEAYWPSAAAATDPDSRSPAQLNHHVCSISEHETQLAYFMKHETVAEASGHDFASYISAN